MANVADLEKVLEALRNTAAKFITPNIKTWHEKSQKPISNEEEFVALMREFTEAMHADGIWQ